MGMGAKAPSPPPPQPVVPVPQDDDPKLLDSQRKAAVKASNREGYNAHLLSGSGQDTAMGEDSAMINNQAKLLR